MQSEEIINSLYQQIISKTGLVENPSEFESDQSDGGLHQLYFISLVEFKNY